MAEFQRGTKTMQKPGKTRRRSLRTKKPEAGAFDQRKMVWGESLVDVGFRRVVGTGFLSSLPGLGKR
jgi:hypothetical protein